MKKIRKQFSEIKEGFLSGKFNDSFPAFMLANIVFIFSISLIFFIISTIVYIFNNTIGEVLAVICTILLYVFILWKRAFELTMPISIKITCSLFGKYGRAVTKDDWKRIKKTNKRAYKYILDKKNIGHCYYISWILALWLDDDAKLMYCSVRTADGHHTGHSVVLRNNCVYDTNLRMNCDLDEYLKRLDAEVYKIFEKEVYYTESFFENIYQDFVDWCAERNVYCDPQKTIPTKKEDKA